MTRPSYLAVLLTAMACGPTLPDDDDGAGSGGSDSDGTSAGDSTSGVSATSSAMPSTMSTSEVGSTGPLQTSCNEQTRNCAQIEGCENVSGAEARPGDGPGEFYCSDLGFAFACAEQDTCMRVSGILCAADSDKMIWVIEQCVPDGWAPCPDAECTEGWGGG